MSIKEIHNLDYMILLCRKMKEMKAFYKDVMGFPIELDLENWVSFRVGATLLTLRPRGQGPAWDDWHPQEIQVAEADLVRARELLADVSSLPE